MNWIITLIIGGVVGWLASIVMKTNAQSARGIQIKMILHST